MNYCNMDKKDASANMHMNCIDAGSENCPCYLALTGDCLICSRLQGRDSCNCNWHGVCIYNEFIQGNRKVNNPRRDFEAHIIEKKFYKEDLVVYILDVEKGFAMKAGRPGSYLFVKGCDANSFYDIPISVMKADVEKGRIHLAIKIIAPKTKALLMENEKLELRGPYRNGIHGISAMLSKRGKNQKTLILAKGIGIAPGILATQTFCNRGSVDLVIDTDKISKELIEDYLEDGTIRYLSFAENGSIEKLENRLNEKQYDNVILLASDYYIENFGKMIKRTLPAADLAVSNNFRICCGEGLCGACAVDTSYGDTIKMCKCQFNGEEFLKNVYHADSSG